MAGTMTETPVVTADQLIGVNAAGTQWEGKTGDLSKLHDRAHALLSASDHSDVATYLDQALLVASSPTFAGLTLTSNMLIQRDGVGQQVRFKTAADAMGIYPFVSFYRSRGTLASRSALTSGDYVGGFIARPFDGTDDLLRAGILFVVDGTVDDATNAAPTCINFAVGTTSNAATAARLKSNGDLSLSTNKLQFGTLGSEDANLYRTGANALKTDDSLTVGVDLSVNGNTTLGDAATDTITCTGRLIPRLAASNPQDATPANRPAGTLGEIARYSGKLYLCTNATTPTWELFSSA